VAINFLATGDTVTVQDTEWALLAKAADKAGSGGGGGGTQQVYNGASPPAAPADPTKGALWYPPGGGAIKEWNGAAWV
jgi:hypothetical protein